MSRDKARDAMSDAIAQRDRRIAELEAALKIALVEIVATGEAEGVCFGPRVDVEDVIRAALSAAPAQPATAADTVHVEERLGPCFECECTTLEGGLCDCGCHEDNDAATPSPAATKEHEHHYAPASAWSERFASPPPTVHEATDDDEAIKCPHGKPVDRSLSCASCLSGNDDYSAPADVLSGSIRANGSKDVDGSESPSGRSSGAPISASAVISSTHKSADRLGPLLAAANEVLACADQDVMRFGIEVPADIAWKFAHAVRHAEGDMELLENCAHCNRDASQEGK